MSPSSLHIAAAASRFEDLTRVAAERARDAAPRTRRRSLLGGLLRRPGRVARPPRVVRPAL